MHRQHATMLGAAAVMALSVPILLAHGVAEWVAIVLLAAALVILTVAVVANRQRTFREAAHRPTAENPETESEAHTRLVNLARAEHGELLVDTIWYPGLRQLTAVLVGNHRVVYNSAGRHAGRPS